jgi:hypothetical protein
LTPQNGNSHTTKGLIDNEGDEISISKLKRMIRTINDRKEDMNKSIK